MSRIARAEYSSWGNVRLTFPYQPNLVEALKASIPAYARTYDRATKTWTVSQGWHNHAVRLLQTWFPDALIDRTSGQAQRHPDRHTERLLAKLYLLPTAPPELIEAAYRTLAKRHHPDAGGDPESMRSLNLAYAELKGGSRT